MKQGVLWRWGLALSLGLLVACGGPPTVSHVQTPQHSIHQQSGQSTPQILSKTQASGSGQVQPDPLNPGRAKLSFTLRLNPEASSGFKTKALAPERFQRIQASIVAADIVGLNPAFPNTILADGADAEGYLTIDGDNELSIQFSGVPYGKARAVLFSLDSYPESPLEQAAIGNVFNLSTASASIEVSYRTMPVYWLVAQEDSSANEAVKQNLLDLSELQAFVDEITGKTGDGPYHYLHCHPALINIYRFRDDLRSTEVAFDLNALEPADYRQQGGEISGNISGLVSTDTLDLRVTDPGSPALINQSNGAYSISDITLNSFLLPPLLPTLYLRAKVNGGTNYTVIYQAPAHNVVSNSPATRDLMLRPDTPELLEISPVIGKAGDSVTLTGSNFHANADGNTVHFSNVEALSDDISVDNVNQLQARIPYGVLGEIPVSVSVGTQNSVSQNMTVRLDGPYEVSPDSYSVHQFSFNSVRNHMLALSSRHDGTDYSLDFFRSADQGLSWSKTSLGQGVTNGFDFVLGRNDQHLFAFWADSDNIYVRHSSDSGDNWGAAVNVTADRFNGSGEWANLPRYACINGINYLIIQGREAGIVNYYLYPFNNQLQFSEPVIVPGTYVFGQGSAMYILYTENNNLWLTKSSNGGNHFGAPVRVSRVENTSTRGYAATVDSQGRVMIAYGDTADDAAGDMYLAHSVDGGQSFAYTAVASSNHYNQEYPAIAIDQDDQVHIVWNDQRDPMAPRLYHAMSRDHGLSFEPDYSLGDWLGYSGYKYIVPMNDGHNTLFVSALQRGNDNQPRMTTSRYFAKPAF